MNRSPIVISCNSSRNLSLTPEKSSRRHWNRDIQGKNLNDRMSDMCGQLKNNIGGHKADPMEHINKANFMNIEN